MKNMIFSALLAGFMMVIFSGCGNNNGNCPAGTTYLNGVCTSSANAYQTGVYPNTGYPNGVYPTNGVYPNGVYPTNGVYPNGVYPNGVYPNGIYPNGLVNSCGPNMVMRTIPQTGQPTCLPICPMNPMMGYLNGYGCI